MLQAEVASRGCCESQPMQLRASQGESYSHTAVDNATAVVLILMMCAMRVGNTSIM